MWRSIAQIHIDDLSHVLDAACHTCRFYVSKKHQHWILRAAYEWYRTHTTTASLSRSVSCDNKEADRASQVAIGY
jgi:hypothetical protein